MSLRATFALSIWLAPMAALASPLLHYDFEDSSTPTANLGSLGNGYDGALSGGAGFVAFNGGSAVAFDGLSDFVTPLGAVSAFNFGSAISPIARRYRPPSATVPISIAG